MKLSPRFGSILWLSLTLLIASTSSAEQQRPTNPLRQASVTRSADESTASETDEDQAAEESVLNGQSRVARARQRARELVRSRSTSSNRSLSQAQHPVSVQDRPESIPQHVPSPSDAIATEGVIIDDVPGEFHEVPFYGDDLADCCGGKGCGECAIPCPRFPLENLTLFAGVQGFTGPKNRGGTGSFGFNEGFNWGAPLICSNGCLGMQFGLRATHNNFSGAEFTDQNRNQLFLSGGLFRRVDWGFQGGVVIDYVSDDWYTETDLLQLRGEISWVYPHDHEIGFWFSAHLDDDTQSSVLSGSSTSSSETWQGTDLFACFYRKRWCETEGRLFAGFTNQSDGLIGADVQLPLGACWSLESGFTYLVPEEGRTGFAGGGHEHESWNVGINLVWYPRGRVKDCNYFRPLLNVADNGSFMVDRR